MQQPPPPSGPEPPYRQPPSGQPPFGQPPYAPPPPPRQGPGPLMYCLGCMGILAIIAVIGIFVMVNRVKKAMGPPITAATVQSVLPPGVPLYPGLVIMEEGSRSITLPSKSNNSRMVVLTFRTNEPMTTIGPWYKTRLNQQGWVGGVSPTDANLYQFKKGDTALNLQERPGKGGQNVLSMNIVQGLPAGSVGTPTAP